MAEPVARSAEALDAIGVLEEAARLLRQTPFSTLVCHWTGSIPFAAALLVLWNDLTTQRISDSACAWRAAALAVALAWMNCWRAVAAGRMRRSLSGAPDDGWTRRRVGRLVASQTFLGALKLVALPLAGLVVFPLADAVAFFRSAAVIADAPELDAVGVLEKARVLARVHPRQSWLLLPLLAFLQLVTAANLALVLAVLPFLVRMLTGYESEFNRGDTFLVQSPLFIVLVLVSMWLATDPFVQAAYAVRCFHGESVRTAEDLRVGLRRIRGARVAAAVVLLAMAAARASGAVSQAELERSIQKTMQSPEYGWRVPPPPSTAIGGKPWALRAADKVLEALNGMWRAVGNVIGKVIEWIFGKLLVSPAPGEGRAPGAGLHWSVWLLMAVAAAGAAWILWRRRLLRRSGRKGGIATPTAAIAIEGDEVSADQLPEERWSEMAAGFLREENYRLALRAYYLATLAWLGQRGLVAIHSGKTNGEYQQELRRKARHYPEGRDLFAANVSAFEASWYGMHEVSADGVTEFRARLEGMKKVMA